MTTENAPILDEYATRLLALAEAHGVIPNRDKVIAIGDAVRVLATRTGDDDTIIRAQHIGEAIQYEAHGGIEACAANPNAPDAARRAADVLAVYVELQGCAS